MVDPKVLEKCRLCGSKNIIPVLSLGDQALTGVFPKSASTPVSSGELNLVWCRDCNLLQMGVSYPLGEMYGDNYGYRSGLNASMVFHLSNKIKFLEHLAGVTERDFVIDIGSNDGTSLAAYSTKCERLGVDPTAHKFKEFYPPDVNIISNFFSADVVNSIYGGRPAKVITSIAMFYDLENPRAFVYDVKSLLADDGIWHFEQSYMPSMLRSNAYDTICHEHLEFYSFGVVNKMLDDCGLRVIDVQMNSINGGSFAVTACKKDAKYVSNTPVIKWMLQQEADMRLDNPKPYRAFEERVYTHRKNLLDLVEALVDDGKKIIGYGASTKGNVLLQFCGLTTRHIPYIADVNKDKFGCFTPRTHIPIIPESKARKMKPDYFLVFPWHFRSSILEREKEFINNGGKFIFPLPEIEIV